jgi:NodT family efflux transporter outer membrane factor (OMF) lipoprotein
MTAVLQRRQRPHVTVRCRIRPLLTVLRPYLWPLALAACDLGPAYQRPDAEVPAAYRATQDSAATAWPEAAWWRGFASPALDALIEEARARNFDLAAAAARVRQADAASRIATAALFPSLSAGATAQWQHTGLNTASRSRTGRPTTGSIDTRSYGFGLDASYIVDFWGRNRAVSTAAQADAVTSRFDQQTVALSVVSSVASTWFTALALADRLAVAEATLAGFERTLAAIRGRFDAGTASALDVAQQETVVAIARADIPSFRNQVEQQLLGLGILVGRPPEAVTVRPGSLTTVALPPVIAGLPSELLLRRPDIAAAEAALVAANYDITAARAAFFPTIQLTGSAGYQAGALNALLLPGSALASLAAGLTAPLFDGGALRGRLEFARARYQELEAQYRKAIVQAFTDVDSALTAWRFTAEQLALQTRAVETARRSAAIARAQLQAGTVDITTVTQVEAALFNAEDALTQVRLLRALALLNLYKALGGGWTRPEGTIEQQFPGLDPGPLRGGIALPVGGNLQ